MEWQPIETAPRDGEDVLTYTPPSADGDRGVGGVYIGFWGNLNRWESTDELMRIRPTHWMPLPAAPTL